MWPAFAIPALGYFAAMAIDSESTRIAVKAIPVLALAAGVWLTQPRTRYRSLVAVGLAFGAGGDLLLELGQFVPGLISFLIGHLFYIPAFLGDERRLKPVLGIPFIAYGIALTWALAEGAGDLLVPVAVYAIVISVMAWRAAARIGTVPSISGLTTAVGAVSFVISDSLIALDRFGDPIPGARWWIMTTYWAAQALIAYGAFRREG